MFIRRTAIGWAHYCPGCDELHVIPDTWRFNHRPDCPTFDPSVRTRGVKHEHGTMRAVLDERGQPTRIECHYFLRGGQLQFQADCNHALKSTTVALPPLPDWASDDPLFK